MFYKPHKVRRRWHWLAHFGAGVLCFLLGLMILRSVAPGSPEVLLPGTALTVRLKHPLTSQNTRLGEVFEAWVDSAHGISGASPLPPSARVEGRCVAVRPGEGDGRPGYLRLVLSGLWDAQGHFAPLETTTVSLSGKGPAHKAVQSAAANAEVVVTPDVSLTFVLLKPAVLSARRRALY